MGDSKVSLKLLIDTKAKKVLFAEAGKDFVDFLFHIFSLPLGTVVKLLTTKGMVGSLGHLSKSIQALSSDYLQPDVTKDSVLQPLVTTTTVKLPHLLLKDAPKSCDTKTFFKCSSQYYTHCGTYVSNGTGAICPQCKEQMSARMTYVEPKSSRKTSSSSSCNCSGGGYVKGVATYMVMDNLEVKPMSTISSISLINNFNVNDVSSLVEKQFLVGLNEGIEILKASLESQAVLTTVFLGKKADVPKKKIKRTKIMVTEMVYGAMSHADLQKAIEAEFLMALQDRIMEETKERKEALETYIYDMRNKHLYNEYDGFVTPLERGEFIARLQLVEDWLYDEGDDETKSVYIARLEELKKQGDPIEERYKEHMERGAFINQFTCCVNSYRDAAMSNDPKFDHISNSEKQKVLNACVEAEAWVREKKQQQDALPKHATPILGSADVRKTTKGFHRLCRLIMTKPKPAPPNPRW